MGKDDDRKIDLASVFPAKGDSRRPPDWLGRGLLYTGIAIFIGVYVWQSWGLVYFLVLDVIISIFIALAIEPLVLRLVRHGWKRGAASAVSLFGLLIIGVALMVLFGNMFVQQVVSMVKGLPGIYQQISDTVLHYTNFRLPKIESLGGTIVSSIQTSWLTNFAGQALSTTIGVLGFIINVLTVVMVTYYISAAGPKMRRSLCQWLGPNTQRRFLLGWTVVQDQISGFLFSRTILAAINAACIAVFMVIIQVPYWLPLALFCGITSQFVPTLGTYIGGALPVLFAWGSNGIGYAVALLVYIVVYQQIENLILQPKVSERTMDLNPAIAFLCVLLFGALFGALGAFLALPLTASLQVILKVYIKRYDLVDSPLMSDPIPEKKSKVVEGAEAISEHIIKPVSEHMPRAVQGSSANVPLNEEIRQLREEIYNVHEQGDSHEFETIAIPKGALAGHAGASTTVGDGGGMADDKVPDDPSLADDGSDRDEDADDAVKTTAVTKQSKGDDAGRQRGTGPASSNPRSRWR